LHANGGDWRRDLVLHVGQKHGGMTLAELAPSAGMSLDTVAKAVKRMQAVCRRTGACGRNTSESCKHLAIDREQDEWLFSKYDTYAPYAPQIRHLCPRRVSDRDSHDNS